MLKVGDLYTLQAIVEKGEVPNTQGLDQWGRLYFLVYPVYSNEVEILFWPLLMCYEIKCGIFMDFTS